MKIELRSGQFGWDFILEAENGDTRLIQSDWDYPGTASRFGWVACKKCGLTDGTVDCEHKKASDMITEAGNYLDDHIGDIIDDPGYFEPIVS